VEFIKPCTFTEPRGAGTPGKCGTEGLRRVCGELLISQELAIRHTHVLLLSLGAEETLIRSADRKSQARDSARAR